MKPIKFLALNDPQMPKEEASAWVLQVRAAWMTKMGFFPSEIAEACRDDGSPLDLNEELEHLQAAEKLREITPPSSTLESWSVKY